jgi:hypothetical protein
MWHGFINIEKKGREAMMWRKLALAALLAAAVAGNAQAEVSKVRISKQFGLPYCR